MRKSAFLGVAICLAIAGSIPARAWASPEFLAYEGRDSIHEGQGGDKKTVEGIDFWMDGDPPHKFQVLGAITDRRHETGIYGAIRMSGLESDIAKAAKAAGGDAVILQSEGSDVTGSVGVASGSVNGYASGGAFQANGFAVGSRREIKDHEARYIVVKYLPDDPPTPAPAH